MKKVELLAPAGNLEKLKAAVEYGADAVYAGGEEFGLRAYAGNFSLDQLKEGLDYAHRRGRKLYLTLNIIPHNQDLEAMEEYLEKLSGLGIDAVIVSDPGVYTLLREKAFPADIHLSTQANSTNWRSVLFWHRHGVKRVILARELSLGEIAEIRKRVPEDLELEVFIHGAMCVSYSGRCLLSSYLAERDPNRGFCAQACRWKYYLMEEKRPGQYMPVFENDRGAFILNSRNLCMIEHIPELIATGVSSFKIEGRMKSSYYVATVVKVYREALDAYCDNPEKYEFKKIWLEELNKVSHREYTTGFYLGKPTSHDYSYKTGGYIRNYDFVGLVRGYDKSTGMARVEQRNRMLVGDELEVLLPKGEAFIQKIRLMLDDEGREIEAANHPRMTVYIPMDREAAEYAMLRRKAGGS